MEWIGIVSVLEQKVDTSNPKKPSVPGGLVRVYSKTEKKEEKATEEAGQVVSDHWEITILVPQLDQMLVT